MPSRALCRTLSPSRRGAGAWVRMIVGALRRGEQLGGQAGRRRTASRPAGQPAQEGLARHRDQQRQAEARLQFGQPAQHGEGGLADRCRGRTPCRDRGSAARARCRPAVSAASRARRKRRCGRKSRPAGHRRGVAMPALLHRMHDDQPGRRRRQRGIERRIGKAVNVVEIIDALRQRPALHLGREAIDGERERLSPCSAGTTAASRAISISGGTGFRIGIGRRRADIDDVGAVGQQAPRHARCAASGSRYFPPSEKQSSVMLRMPRIFMRIK